MISGLLHSLFERLKYWPIALILIGLSYLCAFDAAFNESSILADWRPLAQFGAVSIVILGTVAAVPQLVTGFRSLIQGRDGASALQEKQAISKLSTDAQTMLQILLAHVLTEFCWDCTDTIIRELELADVIVRRESLGHGQATFALTDWYHELVLCHRAWLLRHLRVDAEVARSIAVGWNSNAMRRVPVRQ